MRSKYKGRSPAVPRRPGVRDRSQLTSSYVRICAAVHVQHTPTRVRVTNDDGATSSRSVQTVSFCKQLFTAAQHGPWPHRGPTRPHTTAPKAVRARPHTTLALQRPAGARALRPLLRYAPTAACLHHTTTHAFRVGIITSV